MNNTIDEEIAEAEERLQMMEDLRRRLEDEGRYMDAQEVVDKMRALSIKHSKKLEKASLSVNQHEKGIIREKQRLELLTFTRLWDEKISEYEQQSKDIVDYVKVRQDQERAVEEDNVREQLLTKKPRFSKQILLQKELMQKLVKQRKYIEAEDVKKRFKPLELEELKKFDDSLTRMFEKRMQAFKARQQNETNALLQRVQSGRDELHNQRRADFDRLLQHHQNVLNELDQRTRLHVSKTKDFVSKQIGSLKAAPTKTRVDYTLTPRPSMTPSYMTTPLLDVTL